jgi:hypothetical protein
VEHIVQRRHGETVARPIAWNATSAVSVIAVAASLIEAYRREIFPPAGARAATARWTYRWHPVPDKAIDGSIRDRYRW